jgi:hypothetical protein
VSRERAIKERDLTSSFFNILQLDTVLESEVDVVLHHELDRVDLHRHRGKFVDLVQIVIFLTDLGEQSGALSV